ncbi:Neuropeptide-Like Protein [Caenorhabditis elegans]|uniref:Neuropeptide-Like Protein n=1 Tax=Caenorhabditis elegans TaxID=6239 RepID=O45745_CAEEL|nr:Neuropeptide-Like Protein [Caenorhabditis elegans]CAB04677.1 Neuropeptide-Like Protein [Caenorhabditis elegans]|eukprot:NP_505816.1 Neuropeptide-Like Protein [Caenorhabditis elegans]
MAVINRALLLLCILFALSEAYSRMELEDRMQMSRFQEPVKGAAGQMGGDPYIHYLSEYFGRPMKRHSAGSTYPESL